MQTAYALLLFQKEEEVATPSEATTAKPWSLEDEDDDEEAALAPASAETTTENGTVVKNGVEKLVLLFLIRSSHSV